tara:strand:+ start:2407 stop:3537 length:1131 start_codon:yes stop_codon:yes gene_type:complete
MKFKLNKKDKTSNARTGTLYCDHGKIETPIFIPVGTQGSVKTLHQQELVKNVQAEIILSNTYHLFLRPGIEIFKKTGGIHKFINWDLPILTDSGGYQVYSIAEKRKITDEGVEFQSHIDGSKHFFTPEKIIDIQLNIGADFIMAFDECTPYPCDKSYAKKSMKLTHDWLQRCQTQYSKKNNIYGYRSNLIPIIQGSVYKDLRKISTKKICSYDFKAVAIGGLSVGEPADILYDMTNTCCEIIPEEKMRYLMGVGNPVNILECISLGIDMFDCVIPTRNGRNGLLYTPKGKINIKNKKWEYDFNPIDTLNYCSIDKNYSKAYLRHLFMSKEILGMQIASFHNLSFYTWLIREARKKINAGCFGEWKNKMSKILNETI